MTDAKRAYNRQYYIANRERLIADQRARYSAKAKEYTASYKNYRKAWRQSNKVRVRRVNQAWYRRIKSDPVAWAAKQAKDRAYREATRERQNARCRAWVKANPEKRRIKFKRAKAKRRGAAGHFTREQWIARVEYYGNCCAYCHTPLTKPTIDHVIAVVVGGSNWASNLVPACTGCNSRKQDQRWIPRPVWQPKEN